MKKYLSLIDRETPGNRYDVTPIFTDPEAFKQMVSDLYTPFLDSEIDLIAGIDALGFILGSALAQHTGKGFLPIRKGGKLPVETDSVMEYVWANASTQPITSDLSLVSMGAFMAVAAPWCSSKSLTAR